MARNQYAIETESSELPDLFQGSKGAADNHSTPTVPVGTDLFELKGIHYLLTVDYFSRYPEVTKLMTITSSAVIAGLKAAFSRHGIPEVVRSDNGPQYSSHEFAMFADSYGFKHALFPPSNGQAERAVKTMKQLLEKSSDPVPLYGFVKLSVHTLAMVWSQPSRTINING